MKTTKVFESVRPGTLSRRCSTCTHKGDVNKAANTHRCSLTGWTILLSSVCSGHVPIDVELEKTAE